MKAFTFVALLSCTSIFATAQEIKDLDASPLDLAVFRPDGQNAQPVARIIYSRPQAKGRTVFGELVPYGKLWRLGANQSTELNTYKDMTIGGKELPIGNYTMYAIPNKDEWTIIISSQLFTWGAYDYDEKYDIVRIAAPVSQLNDMQESFGIAFGGSDGKGTIKLAWEHTAVNLAFTY